MKTLIEKIKNNGIQPSLTQELKQNIEICNVFNIIDMFLVIPFVFLFRHSPLAASLTALTILFHLSSFLLIRFHNYNLGRFIYSITTATTVYFAAALIYNDHGTDGMAAKFLILGAIIMPFIVFKKEEWKYTFVALSLDLFYIISFNYTNSQLNIPSIRNYDSVELRLLSIITTFVIFCSIFFYYKKIIIEQNLKLDQSNKDLLVKNDDLQKSDATKNKLFSIIAHDLKNPLHAILSFAEIFHTNHDLFNAEELKEFSKDIYDASKNTCNIAENLLSWSRSQLKCITINAVKLDLDKFISDTVSNLKNTADNKEVEIKVYKIKKILAYADIDIAKVVLQNLLTNAIKFSHRQSTISINAKLKQIDNNEYVEICVADSGLGINVDYLKQLFKSKDLKSIAGTENEQGTGIGLMLCKDFAERNGGKIWVESEFGKGSKFYFTLPKLKSSVSYTPLPSAKVACSV